MQQNIYLIENIIKNGKIWNRIVEKYGIKGGLPSENIYLNGEKIHRNRSYLNPEWVSESD